MANGTDIFNPQSFRPNFFQGFNNVEQKRRPGLSFLEDDSNVNTFSYRDAYNSSSQTENTDANNFSFRFKNNSADGQNTVQTPVKPNTSSNAADGKTVTVQPGDSISKIMLNNGFSRAEAFDSKLHGEIATRNGLENKNKIFPGKPLILPIPGAKKTNTDSKTDAKTPTDANTEGKTDGTNTTNTEATTNGVSKTANKPVTKKNPFKKSQPTTKSKEAQKSKSTQAERSYAVGLVKSHMVNKSAWSAEHINVVYKSTNSDGSLVVTVTVNDKAEQSKRGKTFTFSVVNGKINQTA